MPGRVQGSALTLNPKAAGQRAWFCPLCVWGSWSRGGSKGGKEGRVAPKAAQDMPTLIARVLSWSPSDAASPSTPQSWTAWSAVLGLQHSPCGFCWHLPTMGSRCCN